MLEKYGVELIGAKLAAIDRAEDRQLFKEAMDRLGLRSAPSGIANSVEEAEEVRLEGNTWVGGDGKWGGVGSGSVGGNSGGWALRLKIWRECSRQTNYGNLRVW